MLPFNFTVLFFRYQSIHLSFEMVLLEVLFLGRNRYVVNVKQCLKRGHDGSAYGQVFVSTLVALDIVTCVSTDLYPSFFKVRQL